MTEYCNNKEKREWMLGKNVCDGDPSICKSLVRFGKQEYCGFCPPRCGLHQIVKSQAGCLFCRYYTLSLDSLRCNSCLRSETRINFVKGD